MALSKFELYHGAVLSQVVRNPGLSLKLFERTEEHGWGEYEVSDNHHSYRLFIKSTSQVKAGRKGRNYSNFTFSLNDIEKLRGVSGNVILCLVCGDKEICTLEWEDITALGLLRNLEVCNVIVSWFRGTELQVKSKYVELEYKIPRSRLRNFSWE